MHILDSIVFHVPSQSLKSFCNVEFSFPQPATLLVLALKKGCDKTMESTEKIYEDIAKAVELPL